MQFSYSRLGAFQQCPYKFQLQYIEKLKTLPSDDPQSPLILGHAIHTGIETNVQNAIREYYGAYPIINDLHVNEAIKLENLIPKVHAILPYGEHEVKIETTDFIGFIDLLVPTSLNSLGEPIEYDLYDFKYSNNQTNYLKSPQIHLYKWYFEKLNPGKHIRKINYLFIPKTMIRQKKTETLYEFRERLKTTLEDMKPQVIEVQYDPNKVIDWHIEMKHCIECNEFNKNKSRLCDFCEYYNYCQKGLAIDMALPKNERIPVGSTGYMKGWIYGPPFSGKTTFLDSAPDPLNLNTDGNTKYVTMQRVLIRDEVTTTGRLTNRKFAWEILKEYIDDLEKGSEFKTIILDLVEDTREMCRLYMYDKLGIQHESDAGFGKGYDIIKTEYLSTMRKLLNLDYHIFLCSHEDISKNLTKKTGDQITRIAPNIQEALANKLAGMVDFVARVVVNDDNTRTLSFKSNEVIFGGGRLTALTGKEIPLDWNELMKAYQEAKKVLAEEKPIPEVKPTPTPKVKEETKEETPVETTPEDDSPVPEVNPNTGEVMEDTKPVRRTRKVRE